MIPALTPITATVAPWSERLWLLLDKERAGTISAPELHELNLTFRAMDADQDVSAMLPMKEAK